MAGNCRICCVQVEGRSWVEIACNMPVAEGLRVLTDSDAVKEYRKSIMQLMTLNHPVDCGICDKAGECTLQDYHYKYNGAPSMSRDAKVRSTKFHPLSERIVLDNERCILCSRCVRFTREISKSNALGIIQRGDYVAGARRRGPTRSTPIRTPTTSSTSARSARCFRARSCTRRGSGISSPRPPSARAARAAARSQIWHRKPEWKLNALDPRQNVRIERVTPLENPQVNGPWICNKGRDLAQIFERPRATQAMQKGKPVDLPAAIDAARRLIESAERPVALVSSWGSNEELARVQAGASARASPPSSSRTGRRSRASALDDDLLIRADKNPNTAAARALFPQQDDGARAFAEDTDLVLVWGEGFDFARIPAEAKIIFLNAYLQPENGHADVFIPISIQTERRGHYTNFEGVVSAFEPCFAKPASVADAEALFAAIAATESARA